ncbi:MAG: glycosyl hydrolase family 18 protein [Desulfitobacteriaceae bacterium]
MALNVLAFYNGLNERAKGYPYLQRYGSLLTHLAVFQISIQNDGQLRGVISRKLVQEAHEMGIKVLPVFSNLGAKGQFSTPLISRLLRDQNFADKVWQNIRNYVLRYRGEGVNLDLEKANSEDRKLYTQFISDWGQKFARENLFSSLDVPAKTSDAPQKAWTGVFDYRVIGQNIDAVVLMTYEEHWPGSAPGSIASLPWVTQVVDYALSQIPAKKVYLGLPLYGYDWAAEGGAEVISYRRALLLAQRFGAPLRWDQKQHSTYFTYEKMGQRHRVYFEDPRSTREKLDLAQDKGLRGVAIWEMNLSYPEFWQVLEDFI